MAEAGLTPVLAGALALGLAGCAALALRRLARGLPAAVPTDRSLHDRPVPRVGGLSIWAGFIPAALACPPVAGVATVAWLGGWMVVAGVSLADDWRGVSPLWRLAVHGMAAIGVAVAIIGAPASLVPGVAMIALAALVIMWSANLFNFMDGSDGLAALMAIAGFAAYAAAAAVAREPAQVYVALAAAVIPFLALNAPPARAFMGDVGAVPLGFLAATFGVVGCRSGTWPWWFPLLVFLPFVADASTTLVARLLRGERVLEAHRTHYYQRLHQLGAGHRGTLAVYGILMAGTAGTALVALAMAPGLGAWALGAWSLGMAAFFAAIDYHWQRPRRGT